MANHLPLEKKAQIAQLLCEGTSLRAASRIADVAFNTVLKLVPQLGEACIKFHNEKVVNLQKTKLVQADEVWSFCYAKQKNVTPWTPIDAGDCWTWTALDSDSKLIISWVVGARSLDSATALMSDLQSRVVNRIQLTTASLGSYRQAVLDTFGGPNIDYGQLHKTYESTQTETRYSPAQCTGIKKKAIACNPDFDLISTSHVERSNLTLRMHSRRFTRLTNAFSKKLENHMYAVALYTTFYNFIRIHKTLRVTPAMEAGIGNRPVEFIDLIKYAEGI